jgi:hypothetical protein
MLVAFSTAQNRRRTFILVAACGLLAITAAAVGIDDNFPGVLLAYLSASAFILAFVHPWRSSRQFRYLIYVAGLGFIIFAVLHNVFEAVASKPGVSGLIPGLLNGIGGAFFIVAVLLCPPALLVGIVGAVIMYRRERHLTPGAPAA